MAAAAPRLRLWPRAGARPLARQGVGAGGAGGRGAITQMIQLR